MKTKKILAASLAAAMMVSTLPAATVSAEEIEGGVIYVKQDIYDVTLPTTSAQKFYLDPEGLIALGKDPDNVTEPKDAGTVVGAKKMYAVNRSSVPVVLSATYKITDSAEDDDTEKVEVIENLDANDADELKKVQEAKEKKVAISISAVQSKKDAEDATDENCGGNVFKAATAGVDITDPDNSLSDADVIYAGETAVPAEYVMTKETYEFKLKNDDADPYDANSYEYVIDSTAKKASCVELTIGGYCSKNADWTAYTDGTNELKLDIVFKFKKAATAAGDWTDTKVSSVTDNEVKVGPQVTISNTGLVTISGLTADKNYKAISVTNGVANGTINNANVTWNNTNWSSTDGGTLTCQLKDSAGWPDWYAGKTLTVTVTLTDDSTVTGSQVMP